MTHDLRQARLGLIAVLCFAAIACGAPVEVKDAPLPISAATIQAWSDAGAEMGWMSDAPAVLTDDGDWNPWLDERSRGAVPAFRFRGRSAKRILTALPDPGTPFGLDFHAGFYAEASLKEIARLEQLVSLNLGCAVQGTEYADLTDLAGMKRLRSLHLFYLQVTDEQARHLAKLESLQVLDLSDTPITDIGLAELEGLSQLRRLNVRYTDVTPAGIARLQAKLPRCKILTDEE